jgi:voltage-gated potassium channel
MTKAALIADPIRKARNLLLIAGGIVLLGTVGYVVIEGWSWFDALYMTIITLGTVGYGETNPLGIGGRIFTMVLILGGMSVLVYAITEITATIVEGELTGVLRTRKIMKQIDKLTDHYIVCGAGRSGHHILHELQKTGRQFVGIEIDKEKVGRFLDEGMIMLLGDATDEEVLKLAGIERAAGFVSALPDDKDNLFVVITARGMNPKMRIVSRMDDIYGREKFVRSGANAIVSTNFIGGMRMASELVRPATTSFLDLMLRGNNALRVDDVKIGETSHYIGRTLAECTVIEDTGVVLLSVMKGTHPIFNPPKTHTLAAGETLVVIGTPEQMVKLRDQLSV